MSSTFFGQSWGEIITSTLGHLLSYLECWELNDSTIQEKQSIECRVYGNMPFLWNGFIPAKGGFRSWTFILGVTLQSKCKFSQHARLKLVKANRCLHVLRALRREQYSKVETDHLFNSLVQPNFTYCLSVYRASESTLNIIQLFLDRCHKHRFVSSPVSIKDI